MERHGYHGPVCLNTLLGTVVLIFLLGFGARPHIAGDCKLRSTEDTSRERRVRGLRPGLQALLTQRSWCPLGREVSLGSSAADHSQSAGGYRGRCATDLRRYVSVWFRASVCSDSRCAAAESVVDALDYVLCPSPPVDSDGALSAVCFSRAPTLSSPWSSVRCQVSRQGAAVYSDPGPVFSGAPVSHPWHAHAGAVRRSFSSDAGCPPSAPCSPVARLMPCNCCTSTHWYATVPCAGRRRSPRPPSPRECSPAARGSS